MDLSDVRVALTPEDLERVGRFRYGIYVEEQGKATRHADHERKRLIEPEDRSPKSLVLWIEREGRILGTVRADIGPFDEEITAQLQLERLPFLPPDRLLLFTRMMVAADMRHSDVTQKLCFCCLALGITKGVFGAVLTCRPQLHRVFETYGWLQYAPEYEHAEAGSQMPMAVLGEPDYFASRQSPVVEWLRQHRHDSPYTPAFLEAVAAFRSEQAPVATVKRASRLVSKLDLSHSTGDKQ